MFEEAYPIKYNSGVVMVIKVYSLNLCWKSLDPTMVGLTTVDTNTNALARTLEASASDFIALQEAGSYGKIESKTSASFRQTMKKIEGTVGTETVVTLYHKNYVLEETKSIQIGTGNRVCLLAFFSNKLCFINVHAPHQKGGKSGATQTMEAIKAAIPTTDSLYNKLKTYDLIFAGDFNCINAASDLNAAGGWLGRGLALNGNHVILTVKIGLSYIRPIDFILSTKPVSNIKAEIIPSSDHKAIIADVDLTSSSGTTSAIVTSFNPRNIYQSWTVDDDDENPLLEELRKKYKISTLQNCDLKGSCTRSVRSLYDQARRDGMIITDQTYFQMLNNYLTDLRNSISKRDATERTVRRLNLKQMYVDSYLVGKILRFYNYPSNYLQNIYGAPLQRSVVNYLDQIDSLKAKYPVQYQAQDAAEIVELNQDIENAEEAQQALQRMGLSPSVSVSVVPRVLRIFDY